MEKICQLIINQHYTHQIQMYKKKKLGSSTEY